MRDGLVGRAVYLRFERDETRAARHMSASQVHHGLHFRWCEPNQHRKWIVAGLWRVPSWPPIGAIEQVRGRLAAGWNRGHEKRFDVRVPGESAGKAIGEVVRK